MFWEVSEAIDGYVEVGINEEHEICVNGCKTSIFVSGCLYGNESIRF